MNGVLNSFERLALPLMRPVILPLRRVFCSFVHSRQSLDTPESLRSLRETRPLENVSKWFYDGTGGFNRSHARCFYANAFLPSLRSNMFFFHLRRGRKNAGSIPAERKWKQVQLDRRSNQPARKRWLPMARRKGQGCAKLGWFLQWYTKLPSRTRVSGRCCCLLYRDVWRYRCTRTISMWSCAYTTDVSN